LTASQLLEPDYPELIKTFWSMIEPDPSCRSTAAEALKFVHEYHDGFTRAQLKGPVPKPDLSLMTVSQMVKRTNETNARQAAREKKRLEAELTKALVTIQLLWFYNTPASQNPNIRREQSETVTPPPS